MRNFILLICLLLSWPAAATPQFARKYGFTSCQACHSVPPQLNANGLAFQARGYRPATPREEVDTVPLAAWLTARRDESLEKTSPRSIVSKVEFISGGPIGDELSYFVEWRPVSLEITSAGKLLDRSGRFEDAFITWQPDPQVSLTVGQYRAMNQVDVSRRLSISEPVAFSNSLAGDRNSSARLQSLGGFSPSGRSPGITLGVQSIQGERASDGLFHYVTLPFVGEFSVPLTAEASREASFELHGQAKGVFLETFYRENLNSIGVHAFVDGSRRFLLNGVGTVNFDDFYATASLGFDQGQGRPTRTRMGLDLMYLPSTDGDWKPGLGFRVERVNPGTEPAYIPYFVLSGPNTDFTNLLQIEYRKQRGSDRLFIDYSIIF